MQRLRELMAHGGIAVLAVVFALALAMFELATATAQSVVFAIQQRASDSGSDLSLAILGTEIYYAQVLAAALAALLVVAVLYVVWRLAWGATRECPECTSEVPRRASVCRYCTTELPEAT